MRAKLFALGLVLLTGAVTLDGAAQTSLLPPSTPPPTQPPPAAPPTYPAPPRRLELPADASLDAVRAARGNLARWRQQHIDANPTRPIDPVGGYFAVFNESEEFAGVGHGTWRGVAGAFYVELTYVRPHHFCGGTVGARPRLSNATYLGPHWRPEYDALDLALGGNGEARQHEGRALGAGVRPPRLQLDGAGMSRFYPTRALEAEREGRVLLSCLVREDRSAWCLVAEEEPIGWGFRDAALRMYRTARAEMTASDGSPSAGVCVRTEVLFQLADEDPPKP